MKGRPPKRRGTPRGKQAKHVDARRVLDPTAWRKELLAGEIGTIVRVDTETGEYMDRVKK